MAMAGAPNIAVAKRAGLRVDLARLAAEGDGWSTPDARYALKTYGAAYEWPSPGERSAAAQRATHPVVRVAELGTEPVNLTIALTEPVLPPAAADGAKPKRPVRARQQAVTDGGTRPSTNH